jgi:hypothetical protein
MQQHIIDTIKEIDSRIAWLASLRMNLESLFATEINPEVEPLAQLRSPQTSAARPSAKPNAKKKSTAPIRAGDSTNRNMAACLKLEQPFTIKDLSAVTELTPNGANSCFTRWGKLGLVKRVSFGQYERTAKFPNQSSMPLPPRVKQVITVSIPGLDPEPKGTTSEQLEKALKDRDHARNQGNTTLERILQDKCDKLARQVES